MSNEKYKTVYRLRRSFLANFILFTCALVWGGVAALNGNHEQFNIAMILFGFHLSMSISVLIILRFFPNPGVH